MVLHVRLLVLRVCVCPSTICLASFQGQEFWGCVERDAVRCVFLCGWYTFPHLLTLHIRYTLFKGKLIALRAMTKLGNAQSCPARGLCSIARVLGISANQNHGYRTIALFHPR